MLILFRIFPFLACLYVHLREYCNNILVRKKFTQKTLWFWSWLWKYRKKSCETRTHT